MRTVRDAGRHQSPADALDPFWPAAPPDPGSRSLGREALSPREMEIARLTCRGLSNKEIGLVLEISHHTVAAHLRRVYVKLQISRRAALAARIVLVETTPLDPDR